MRSARSSILAGGALALALAADVGAAPATPTPALTFNTPHTTASEAGVAEALRGLVIGNDLARVVKREADREAIVAFYQRDRDFQPLWVADGRPTARAGVAADYLATVDADGLDPRDYPLPAFSGNVRAQAEAEVKFTEAVLTYARHALTGRVAFSRVSPEIEYNPVFDAAAVLQAIAASHDLAQTLDSFEPQQPAYRALKAKYREIRNTPEPVTRDRIGNGPVLRYFRDRAGRETVMSDPRVPRLRERLSLAAEPNQDYNAALAVAVGKFQQAHGLLPTGQLNAPTVEAMNGPSRSRRLNAIVATMERWRWMPRDLGPTHVVLNIPDYNLRVYHDGAEIWHTRVVVGTPEHQTPLLSETMKSITINPTWNVPQSIINNELLPIYENGDPQIFERLGLKVVRNRDGSIRVYQPPSERNALGQIRFNFPNRFLVYQHDTPERYYFDRDRRAYSHGCMRVQDPVRYAELLLSYANPSDNHTVDSIKRMLGGAERQIDFAHPIPVHITYQTAFVDETGKLQLREDIYGHDAKLLAILRSSEREVADRPIGRTADPAVEPRSAQNMRWRSEVRGVRPFVLIQQPFR